MENITLKNLDVTINSGELVSIIGPNGCGKTVLLKMICGKLKNNNVFLDNKDVSLFSLEYKRNNIVCVLNDNIFNTEYVKEELEYYLNILGIDSKDINNRVSNFIEYFSLDDIIKKNFGHTLIILISLVDQNIYQLQP